MLSRVLSVVVVLLSVGLATASVVVDLQSGNSAIGTLDPAGEIETVRIEVPAGAVLKLKGKGIKKGPAISVRITDDLDAVVGDAGEIKEKKTGVSGKVLLDRGGVYTIAVRSRDGTSTGNYSLSVSWKSPKKYDVAPPAEPLGGTVDFRADRGALVNASVTAEKDSLVDPRITHITGPNGFLLPVGRPAKPASDKVTKLSVEFTGDYTLHYANDGTGAGAVKAKVTVKQPKPLKSKVDVSSGAIDTGVPGGGAAIAKVATADQATLITVPAPADGNDPLAAIVGTSIDIPAGALKKPTAIVVGTTTDIDPPPSGEATLTAASEPVFFGPEGLKFNVPATITIPANVVDDEDNIAVVKRSGNTTTVITEGVEVDAGSVKVAVSSFSSFQVFKLSFPPTQMRVSGPVDGFDRFGHSVAISGVTGVVGAPAHDGAGIDSGAAFVIDRAEDGTWTRGAELNASDGVFNDEFGSAIAIHDDTVVVGAVGEADGGFGSGAAYVFTRDGGGLWSEQAKLTAADAFSNDLFGDAVAVHGDTAMVGARGDGDAGTFSGSVYVFTREAGEWDEHSKLAPLDASAGDTFGGAVALDGDTVIVGAIATGDAGQFSGSAYVFTRDGGGLWTQQAKLTASDAAANDFFGETVSINGDTVIVGATGDDDLGDRSGAAYVFTRTGTVWTEQAKLTASDAAGGEFFGGSVGVHADTAIVGAYLDDDGGFASGSAYVFSRNDSGEWIQRVKLVASNAASGRFFGESVAVDGEHVLVGSPAGNDDAVSDGAAYFFDLDP